MLILASTTDSLDVVLNAAHTTNPLRIVAFYRDTTTVSFTPGRRVVNTNGTTQVQGVQPPAASTQRVIDTMTIYNTDTLPKTVTVSFSDNGTRYTIRAVLLGVGEALEYQDGSGWRVFDSFGFVKESAKTLMVSGLSTGRKNAAMLFKNGAQPTHAANFWHSHWASTAIPGAGTLATGNTTAGIIPTNATAGSMSIVNPTGGETAYILGAEVTSTVSGVVLLYDRVFALGALTPTSGAIAGITGTAINRPASGEGCRIAIEVVTAFSSAAHTFTITYTNSNGDTGRTATCVITASAWPIGRVFFATLQAGDEGVRQITGVSGSASPPTGTFNVLIIRPLVEAGVVANVPRSLSTSEVGRREMYENVCAAVLFYNPAGTTASSITVSLSLEYA